jgi:hypothetical protein
VDEDGTLMVSLDKPDRPVKATGIHVPLPDDAERLLKVLAASKRAVRDRTGIDDDYEATKALRLAANDEAAIKRAGDAARAEAHWTKESAPTLPPLGESGRSIRTVSGGAPGLGKRRR